MYKYHCLNPISNVGLEYFPGKYENSESLEDSDVVLVRSANMHEMQLPKNVVAVARAGAGVNNIPLEDYAKEGVVVFNTPGANANGVKEMVIAGMLLASRDIVGGIEWLEKQEATDDIAKLAEKKKKQFAAGKEQNITITASTNMSKEDIDKAVKEAEQFAADDKKKREEVDIRNGADQMVFQTEKMLKENGDKMPADVKSEAEAKLADLKTAVQSGSIDEIKAKQDELSHVFEKMYQAAAAAQQAAGAQPGPDAGANNQQKPNDDGVVDADFKEV